jgi:hypothetical protein
MISIGEIIAKLEAAQGPDRHLDCLVEAFEEKVTDAVQIVRRGDGSVAYWKAVKKDPSRGTLWAPSGYRPVCGEGRGRVGIRRSPTTRLNLAKHLRRAPA